MGRYPSSEPSPVGADPVVITPAAGVVSTK